MLLARGAVAIALALGCSVPAVAANLIHDGSFEKPLVPDGNLRRFSTGETFNGWTVVGATGTVDIITKNFMFEGQNFPPKKGNQFLDLTGNSDSATGVQRTIGTQRGATYEVSFYIGSPYDPSGQLGTSSTVHLLVDGEEIGTFTAKGQAGVSLRWRKYSTQFVAQNRNTAIALINGDPANDTACGIDVVSVTLVPAP